MGTGQGKDPLEATMRRRSRQGADVETNGRRQCRVKARCLDQEPRQLAIGSSH
jgi:hypothetical protein